jgi:hypothetical protein
MLTILRKDKVMKLKNFSIRLLLAAAIISGCAIYAAAGPEKKTQPKGLVVGVFDSRAVCVAYTSSKLHDSMAREKMAQKKKAEKAGDQQKVKQLKEWGKNDRTQRHKQGFGTASVKNLLEHIKKDIPKVAKEAGVDIIVSKWDMAYQAKNAEFVDVTELLIRGFEPSERTLKIIRELKKHKPLSVDVIEKHKH